MTAICSIYSTTGRRTKKRAIAFWSKRRRGCLGSKCSRARNCSQNGKHSLVQVLPVFDEADIHRPGHRFELWAVQRSVVSYRVRLSSDLTEKESNADVGQSRRLTIANALACR